MNEQIINEAIEDVRLIKQVINRTANTFLALGKIFIWWGLLFLIKLGIVSIMAANGSYFNTLSKDNPVLSNFLGYSIYSSFVIAGIIIYIYFSRRISLLGLSRQVMRIWLFILGYNFITPVLLSALKLTLKIDYGTLFQSQTAVSLVTLAIGFYFTYILTNLKLTKWLGIIYLITGIIAFKPGVLPANFYNCLWPLTFLAIGGYFEYKNKKAGGN